MFGDRYILQIARATRDELVVGLYAYLTAKFENTEPEDFARMLAVTVAALVVDDPSDEPEFASFREENSDRVEKELSRLALRSEICELLSGAVYNIGYGRYVQAGGGRLINRYLGFIRADAQKSNDRHLICKMRDDLDRLSPSIRQPISRLDRFLIWRSRPSNPDERSYYEAVKSFRMKYKTS